MRVYPVQVMNVAEACIINFFHVTELRAEDCLVATPRDAEQASDRDLQSVQADARWAVRMIIVEEVLLQAFRETEATASLDTEGLIAIAERKLGNASFTKEIIDYLLFIHKIPQNRLPRMGEIQASIFTSLHHVLRQLRGNRQPKSRAKRKMGDGFSHLADHIQAE